MFAEIINYEDGSQLLIVKRFKPDEVNGHGEGTEGRYVVEEYRGFSNDGSEVDVDRIACFVYAFGYEKNLMDEIFFHRVSKYRAQRNAINSAEV